jgi:2-oxoglutarate dehydrogenase E2 component (dihydrolipoamide succinyltransferase)
MALIDVVMPKMGESIMEATILRWHKKPGDFVRQDETLMDIATDKVDSEVPSTTEGVLEEALFSDNDVVPVGAVIARIRTAQEAEDTQAPAITEPPAEDIPAPAAEEAPPADDPAPEVFPEAGPAVVPYQPISVPSVKTGGVRFYSPLVLSIAASEGIPMSELERIPGSGAENRVTKNDILNYLAGGRKQTAAPTSYAGANQSAAGQSIRMSIPVDTASEPPREQSRTTPVTSYAGNVEVIEMDRMRKYIAEHMVKSKATSAHVTSFAEADMTHIVQWRERVKKDYEKREGEKITYTPLLIEAIVKCLKKFPLINASVEGDRILVKKDINIGMATALPSGNLIVPVIKGADQLNLVGLTRQVNLLASNARNNRLKPDDTQGGTFTFTNVGTFGSLMGTPIINQPQVAILATGAIKKKPVVIEGPEGDSIAIRHMMFVSMSYDHRIIDGSLGATFVTAVVKELENFDVNRSY